MTFCIFNILLLSNVYVRLDVSIKKIHKIYKIKIHI